MKGGAPRHLLSLGISLALAHLKDGVLEDEEITIDNDREEKEANQFATELL